MRDDLRRALEHEDWQKPAARDLTIWLVVLCAPRRVFIRPAWAAQVAWHALTARKRLPRG